APCITSLMSSSPTVRGLLVRQSSELGFARTLGVRHHRTAGVLIAPLMPRVTARDKRGVERRLDRDPRREPEHAGNDDRDHDRGAFHANLSWPSGCRLHWGPHLTTITAIRGRPARRVVSMSGAMPKRGGRPRRNAHRGAAGSSMPAADRIVGTHDAACRRYM